MAKFNVGKSSQKTSSAARRDDVRRTLAPKTRPAWQEAFRHGTTYASLGVALLFLLAMTMIVIWARQQPMVAVGQIMTRTYAARLEFEVKDEEGTRAVRERAEHAAPRVYRERETYIEQLRSALGGLPRAVAAAETFEGVSEDIVHDFGLTQEAWNYLRSRYVDGEGNPTREWTSQVDDLIEDRLYGSPFLDLEQWQTVQLLPQTLIELQLASGSVKRVQHDDLLNVEGDLESRLNSMVRLFPMTLRKAVRTRLQNDLQATFTFDEEATRQKKDAAVNGVADIFIPYEKGEIIYRRGDRLTLDQLDLLQKEKMHYAGSQSPRTLVLERLGILGLIAIQIGLLGGYLGLFYPRILRKPLRLLAISLFMLTAIAMTTVGASAVPQGIIVLGIAPALLLGAIMVVAFKQRVALAVGMAQATLVTTATGQSVGFFVLLLAGVGLAVWQLREIRDRNRLVQAGAAMGIAMAVGAVILGLWERPMVDGFTMSLFVDAIAGAVAGLIVGIFALGILSTVERIFNVTTGLTLNELRDSKQPLLRELQQRALGTFNHSLQVATLAEAAAEVIGADSLLTCVGALYHDIGKMNKPQYFVENQGDGVNRHKNLSPAMSLLIIVGHVKDGIEMAREFNLPRPIHHFIEAHHGTTLVEYFFHVAKEKAEAGETRDEVSEVEFRYPGPKPRTREVAIVMMSDVAESATRAVADPTPTRIEQVVRGLAQKRLLDGQFDDCQLTLRELRQIEDSLIKSLCAIHHSRIPYPKDAEPPAEENERAETPTHMVEQTG